jgi:hypothetical protein
LGIGFDKNTKGIANGPKIAPITPQKTALAPLFFAIKWHKTALTMNVPTSIARIICFYLKFSE